MTDGINGKVYKHASGDALVVASGGYIDFESGASLKIAGTAVTASATELNTVDVTAAGVAQASKAAVLDANKTIVGVRRPVATVTADATLTEADSGKVIILNAAASKTISLPATAAGLTFTFVHQVATTSGTGHAISPVAADLIRGNGLTPADDKDLICTQGTSRIGDSVTLVGDGVDGWYITAITGTWARQA